MKKHQYAKRLVSLFVFSAVNKSMVKVIMDFICFGNRKERAPLDAGKYFSVH